MKILITRPDPDASQLQELFSKDDVMILPLLEVKILNHSSIQDLGHELIFVSKNAVAGFRAYPSEKPVYAVGKGTAEALKNKGFSNIIYPRETEGSEALLALPELQNVRNRRLTIVCGVDSRDHLEKTLLKRGAKVSHLITYQTHFRTLSANEITLLQQNYDLLIVTSNHVLRYLAKLAKQYNPQIFNMPITVLAGNMLESAIYLGFTKPLTVKSFANEHLRHLQPNYRPC